MRKSHYERQIIYTNNISKFEVEIKNLFYAGEKKQNMWWVEFEGQLNSEFRSHMNQ